VSYQVIRIGHTVDRPTKIHDGVFDTTPFLSPNITNINPPATSPQISTDPSIEPPKYSKSPVRLVLQHALLASKGYWAPFLRVLHQNFKSSTHFGPDVPIDLYIPDLRHHNETAMLNQPSMGNQSQNENYLDNLATDLHYFIKHCVLTIDETDQITSQSLLKSPRLAIIGHSLGARTAMLWNLYLTQFSLQRSSSQTEPHQLTNWLSQLPVVSLDASPSNYHHDHKGLFNAMIGVSKQPSKWLHGKHEVKNGLLSISPHLDDSTIAFAIQNNLSGMTLNDALGEKGRQFHPQFISSKRQLINNLNSSSPTTSHADTSQDLSPSHHFWTSDIDYLNVVEQQVHKWPVLTPTEEKANTQLLTTPKLSHQSRLPLLAIGGMDSHRLTLESNLEDLAHFFPLGSVEMIRGNHFAHQGVDSNKAAKAIVDYLTKMM
jgi:hypothetical protein